MQHVVSAPRAPMSVDAGGAATLHQVPFWTDNFTWLLVCEATGEAAAIDGGVADPVLEYVEAQGLRLTTILTTHTHPDHIGLHEALDKAGRLGAFRVVGSRLRLGTIPGLDGPKGEPVDEGDGVRLGALEGQAMLTEGHIDGHVSYRFGELLFCGDTLFAGGCGYLFDGPAATMHASLQRLAGLPESTKVVCAHEYTQDNLRFAWSVEPDNAALAERIREVWAIRARGESTVPSTIGLERATNPFLRVDSPTILASLRAASPEASLNDGAEAFATLRALKDGKAYKQQPESSLPL